MNRIDTKIRATGFNKGQEVDLWYQLHAALDVLCAQLDADGGVTDTDYQANCITALINTRITDSAGNVFFNALSNAEGFTDIRPGFITRKQRHWIMYNFTNAFETLCEQLDGDAGITAVNFEALCYTAKFLHNVRDPKGVTDLGNGTTYYFSAGNTDRKQLVEWLYNAVDALETLGEKLDADGDVTDTDYEANTYTAYLLVNIENAAGSVIGN
jgi:hypothetical protein